MSQSQVRPRPVGSFKTTPHSAFEVYKPKSSDVAKDEFRMDYCNTPMASRPCEEWAASDQSPPGRQHPRRVATSTPLKEDSKLTPDQASALVKINHFTQKYSRHSGPNHDIPEVPERVRIELIHPVWPLFCQSVGASRYPERYIRSQAVMRQVLAQLAAERDRRLAEVPYLIRSPNDGKRMYGCFWCSYVSDRKNNLKRHVTAMHLRTDRMLECCGAPFESKAALRDHVMAFHDGGYACAHCRRVFCRKALLTRHMVVHNGRKDYACALCNYATSHKSNLERHRKVHQQLGADCEQEFDASVSSLHEKRSRAYDEFAKKYGCGNCCECNRMWLLPQSCNPNKSN